MTESTVETAAATPVAAKTKKATSPKVSKVKSASKKAAPTHPPTAQMVNNAIRSLKERGGSSLQAIKKYISSTYKVDAEKIAPFIKKYLKTSVDNGSLIRPKGQGASGSFKLAVSKLETSAAKKPKAISATKKAAKPKKGIAAKKTTASTKPKATTKAPAKKAVSKAKKPAKVSAVKKPKSPKPKKAPAKKAAKKPAPKK